MYIHNYLIISHTIFHKFVEYIVLPFYEEIYAMISPWNKIISHHTIVMEIRLFATTKCDMSCPDRSTKGIKIRWPREQRDESHENKPGTKGKASLVTKGHSAGSRDFYK